VALLRRHDRGERRLYPTGALICLVLLLVLGAEKPRPAAWIIDLVSLLFLFFLGRYLWRLYDRRKRRKQEAGLSR
jgi:hypothetical protein